MIRLSFKVPEKLCILLKHSHLIPCVRKSHKVSNCLLSILADFSRTVVSLVRFFFGSPVAPTPFQGYKGTVWRAPRPIDFTVTSCLTRSRYVYRILPPITFICDALEPLRECYAFRFYDRFWFIYFFHYGKIWILHSSHWITFLINFFPQNSHQMTRLNVKLNLYGIPAMKFYLKNKSKKKLCRRLFKFDIDKKNEITYTVFT